MVFKPVLEVKDVEAREEFQTIQRYVPGGKSSFGAYTEKMVMRVAEELVKTRIVVLKIENKIKKLELVQSQTFRENEEAYKII